MLKSLKFIKYFLLIGSIVFLTACDLFRADTRVIRWTQENSPYLIDVYTVEKGERLIIEPGVTVEFKTRGRLIIEGELTAIGTETDSILFTTRTDTVVLHLYDYWSGMEFDSCDSRTCLKYCRFEKYRDTPSEIIFRCIKSSPTFSYCYFPTYTPMVESGSIVIGCFLDSSPTIEHSILYHTACGDCIACVRDPYEEYINESSSNPKIISNDIYNYKGDYAAIGGGFLNKNYIYDLDSDTVDVSLGSPVDRLGDGAFTTTSSSCVNVDGIKSPRKTPHYSDE